MKILRKKKGESYDLQNDKFAGWRIGNNFRCCHFIPDIDAIRRWLIGPSFGFAWPSRDCWVSPPGSSILPEGPGGFFARPPAHAYVLRLMRSGRTA